MGLLPVLVYYASVSKAGRILAEFKNRTSSRDLAPVVVECMEQVPPLHSRFTLIVKRRIFSCLNEGPFTYCCIVDEALGKADASTFLESVRDEFLAFLDSHRLRRDGENIEAAHPMVSKEFGPTIKVLTLPLIGVPQKEIDSLKSPTGVIPNGALPSPSMTDPLYSGSERSDGMPEMHRSASRIARSTKRMNQVQQHLLTQRGDEEESGTIEVVVVSNSNNGNNLARAQEAGDLYPHKSFSIREAENRWWRNVKIVLVVDVVVCVLLFVVWLGICRGFECVS